LLMKAIQNIDDSVYSVGNYSSMNGIFKSIFGVMLMSNKKVKVVTPEQLLGEKAEKVMWHHGTCDMCSERLILICHFGYDTQPNRDYRICRHCMNKWFVQITEWMIQG